MRLDILLEELRDNLLHDRTDEVDGTDSLLWSDATLVRYINEAQRRFARRALVLRDAGSTDVTQITLVEGQGVYPLHKSIMAVLSAKLTAESVDLPRTGHAVLNGYRLPTTRIFDVTGSSSTTPGKTVAYATDEYLTDDGNGSMSRATFRVYPVPSADQDGDTIDLRVIRMPLEDLTTANMKADPEIPEEFHLEMLDWAAYLALRIVDIDAGMDKRAEGFAKTFEAHVAEAKKDALRKLFAPSPWVFGRGGFTWEHGHG